MLVSRAMDFINNGRAPRRSPDFIRREVLEVLSGVETIMFNDIFERVLAGMKQKGISIGGEEILRLRMYEKLQTLVAQGALRKRGKEYTVLEKLASIREEEEENGAIMPKGFI